MAQAVSRRPVTAEARVRSRLSPCGICGGQSGTGTGFPPSTSVFPCKFYSTGFPLQGKTGSIPVHVGFVVDKVALGQVFPRVLRFSLVNFIPPVLHYKGGGERIIFITGLHNKPQGCGRFVASAVGPFTKIKLRRTYLELAGEG
jgi:hypothetical protein